MNAKILLSSGFLLLFTITGGFAQSPDAVSSKNEDPPFFELGIETTARTRFLYRDHYAVFVPVFTASGDFAVAEDFLVRTQVEFAFGYSYLLQGIPYGFFLEEVIHASQLCWVPSKGFALTLNMEETFNIRNFEGNSRITTGMDAAYDFTDWFSAAAGLELDFFMMKDFGTEILPYFRLTFHTGGEDSLLFVIVYEGRFGFMIDSYNRRKLDPSSGIFESVRAAEPFFSRYSQALSLDLRLTADFGVRYSVINTLYFENDTGSYVLEENATLRSLAFDLALYVNLSL